MIPVEVVVVVHIRLVARFVGCYRGSGVTRENGVKYYV